MSLKFSFFSFETSVSQDDHKYFWRPLNAIAFDNFFLDETKINDLILEPWRPDSVNAITVTSKKIISNFELKKASI